MGNPRRYTTWHCSFRLAIRGRIESTNPRNIHPANKPKQMNDKPTTYWKGDLGEYVGTSEWIAGGLFFHLLMKEGIHEGKIKITTRQPDGFNPSHEQTKIEWQKMQVSFKKLHANQSK